MKRFPSSSLETLESRIAPAAVFVDASTLKVALAKGILTISPLTPASDTEIHFQQTPEGNLLISDGVGDDDLEELPNFTGAVNAVVVTTGAGSDLIDFSFLAPGGFRGNLLVSTGGGSDAVHFAEGTLTGAIGTLATGELQFTVGAPEVAAILRGPLSVKSVHGSFLLEAAARTGALTVAGADDFVILGSVAGPTTLAAIGSSSFQLGSFTGTATTLLNGPVRLLGSFEVDTVEIGHLLAVGPFTVQLSRGDNSFSAGAGAFFTSSLLVETLGGDDTVTLGAPLGGGPTIIGPLALRLGEAATGNVVNIDGGLLAGGFGYLGGNGADTVSLAGTTRLLGTLAINAGHGENVVALDAFSSLTQFAYVGGSGHDELTLGPGTGITAIATISLGAGDDTLRLHAAPDDLFMRLAADGGTGLNSLIVPDGSALLGPAISLRSFTPVS